MKRSGLIVLALLGGLTVHAQTNATGTLPMPRGLTLINAETADFDLAGHEATYRGHVRVDDPQMKLVCEKLVADVPQAGGHVNHIVAETNVVIDFRDNQGHTNHATSDKAVYLYSERDGVTNETVTLTGNPQMENAQGTQAGDAIIWYRADDKIHIDNPHLILHQNLGMVTTATNSPAPAKTTNVPPGANDNPDKNTGDPSGSDL